MAKLPSPAQSQSEFVLPEEGVYTVELVDYDGPKPSTFDVDKETIELHFAIRDDDDYDGVKIRQYFGYTMHERSKLYGAVKALIGGQIDDDDELDLDDLMGKRALGTVTIKEKPRRDNPAEMARFPRLDAFSPIRKKKAKKPVEPEPELDDDDDEEWPESA